MVALCHCHWGCLEPLLAFSLKHPKHFRRVNPTFGSTVVDMRNLLPRMERKGEDLSCRSLGSGRRFSLQVAHDVLVLMKPRNESITSTAKDTPPVLGVG